MIRPDSIDDLPYLDVEINRDSGEVNRNLKATDATGPLESASNHLRHHGNIRILDAGCGSGYGLVSMKEQITLRTALPEDSVEAVGVSLSDFRNRIYGDWLSKRRVRDGYIDYRVGNLATIQLRPEHFDVAYSYQVLLHNKNLRPVFDNVLPSLAPGGTYYFDILPRQTQECEAVTAELRRSGWDTLSKPVTSRLFDGSGGTRIMNKLIKP